MKKFISNFMFRIYSDFVENINSTEQLCYLDDLRYDKGNVPDYRDAIIRQLYLLRYFPAYLFEYYSLYRALMLDFPDLEEMRIISLGCGCGTDYYGLRLACKEINRNPAIVYSGVDEIDWGYRDGMSGQEFEFINFDLGRWKRLPWTKYNIILFPRSIGEFSQKDFYNLRIAFANTNFTEERIFVCSSIRNDTQDLDNGRLDRVKGMVINSQGYRCTDDRRYSYASDAGISKEYQGFKYPDYIYEDLASLKNRCTCDTYNPQCQLCSIDRKPILRLNHIVVRVIALEKTVSI